MAWTGTVTWENLLAILRTLVGESTASFPDADLLDCTNAAILDARGRMFIPNAKAAITVVTGTSNYEVPADFAYIDEVRAATGARLRPWAWELTVGSDACDASADIYFRAPFFTPTTGSNPTIHGWKAQNVVAELGDFVSIDIGFVQHQALAYAHSALGAGSSEWAAWQTQEHAKHAAIAEQILKDTLLLSKYRPGAEARPVPGRISGQ